MLRRGVRSQTFDKLVTKVLSTAATVAQTRACASSITTSSGAGAKKLSLAPLSANEIHRHHDLRIDLEERLPNAAFSFKASRRPGEDKLRFEVELLRKLLLPLLGKVRRAEDCKPFCLSAVD